VTQCVSCLARAVQRHHVIYRQELRHVGAEWRERGGDWKSVDAMKKKWLADDRNLIPLCQRCHERHHTRFEVLPIHVLPDSVFEFAAELMGAGAAYEYLKRRYTGMDRRLSALLEDVAA
jgi:cytochrome c553